MSEPDRQKFEISNFECLETSDSDQANTGVSAAYRETTDAVAGTSTIYTISPGDSFTGTLSSAGDWDWIAVELEAGQTYTIELNGTGANPVQDTYLLINDSAGGLLAYNDDGGPGFNSALNYTASYSGTHYLNAGAYGGYYAGSYTLQIDEFNPAVFANDEIANQLTNGFWTAFGQNERSFNIGVAGSLTVDITGLTSAGQFLARNALEIWTDATGISFMYVTNGAQIRFDDNDSGAYSTSSLSGTTIESSFVNVSTAWLDAGGTSLNSYSFQTYIHEIGHALGLGHAGNYNGSATYGVDNHYANDSWQASIMSYFSQAENTSITASHVYAVTPQVADLIAIRNLYGTSGNTRTGNTTYGDGANSNDLMDTLSSWNTYISYTVVDDGGSDTLNFSSYGGNQTIDLREEAISSVRGYVGNLIISRGSVIEHAIGGSGNDIIIGNGADNVLQGRAGSDTYSGGAGNDTIYYGTGDNFWHSPGVARNVGGSGTDTLVVEAGSSFSTSALSAYGFERFVGNNGSDRIIGQLDNVDYFLDGGSGNDELTGSGGDDTIIGGAGSDLMWGRGGNDTIHYSNGDGFWEGNGAARDVGGSGTDTLVVEAGSYFITAALGSYGFERFFGSSGSDRVTGNLDGVNYYLDGGAGNDELTGAGGNDTIRGGAGSDLMWGRGGDDRIYYTSGDNFWNNSGIARNIGGVGRDTMVVESGSYFHTSALGAYGFERFIGNSGSDRITGQLGTIDYHLDGGAGNDILIGSSGDDTIIGGAGSDEMWGHGGDDTIHYSNGDRFWTGPGVARNVGGAGTDTLIVQSGSYFNTSALGAYGFERFIGNNGADRVTGQFDSVDYYLDGGVGHDVLTGSGGNDTLIGGAGNDLMWGHGGDDTIHYSNGDNFWYSPGAARNIGGSGTDTLTVEGGSFFRTSALGAYGFERFIGNNGVDNVTGHMDSVNYHLDGGAGNDVLTGSGGDDTIIGGAGSDLMHGHGGDDAIYYSNGDQFWFGSGAARDVGGSGTDTLLVEAGSVFRTSALGAYGFERFIGADGDDQVTGHFDGIDYHLDGGLGHDILTGSGGNDILIGGSGNDRLFGGAGNDTIDGGMGTNFLTGGAGSDTFVFNLDSRAYQSNITDFEDGVDLIDLSQTGYDFDSISIISWAGNAWVAGVIMIENFNPADLSESDFIFA